MQAVGDVHRGTDDADQRALGIAHGAGMGLHPRHAAVHAQHAVGDGVALTGASHHRGGTSLDPRQIVGMELPFAVFDGGRCRRPGAQHPLHQAAGDAPIPEHQPRCLHREMEVLAMLPGMGCAQAGVLGFESFNAGF